MCKTKEITSICSVIVFQRRSDATLKLSSAEQTLQEQGLEANKSTQAVQSAEQRSEQQTNTA